MFWSGWEPNQKVSKHSLHGKQPHSEIYEIPNLEMQKFLLKTEVDHHDEHWVID
jgi:hypothetical protein